MERTTTSIVIIERGSEQPLCLAQEAEFSYLERYSRHHPIFRCVNEKQAIEVVHFPTIAYNSTEAHPCTERVRDLLPDGVKIATMRVKTEFKAIKYEAPDILKATDTFACPPVLARHIVGKSLLLADTYALIFVDAKSQGWSEKKLRSRIGKPIFFGDRFLKRYLYGCVPTSAIKAFPEWVDAPAGADFALVCSEIER